MRMGEEAQEEERVLGGGGLQILDRGIDRAEACQQHQPFEDPHARAREMIGQLL
jgi:hypothetical protein